MLPGRSTDLILVSMKVKALSPTIFSSFLEKFVIFNFPLMVSFLLSIIAESLPPLPWSILVLPLNGAFS